MFASKRAEVGSILVARGLNACEEETTGVSLRSGMRKKEKQTEYGITVAARDAMRELPVEL